MGRLTQITDITGRIAANYSLDADRVCWDQLGAPHHGRKGPFKPPEIDLNDPESAIWLRVLIRPIPGTERGWGIGDAPRYATGIIVGQTMFPRYSSPALGVEYAEEFAVLFHRQNFGTVRCQDASEAHFINLERWPNFQPIEVTVRYEIYEVN